MSEAYIWCEKEFSCYSESICLVRIYSEFEVGDYALVSDHPKIVATITVVISTD